MDLFTTVVLVCSLISVVCPIILTASTGRLNENVEFLTNTRSCSGNCSLTSSSNLLPVIYLLRISSMADADIGFQTALDVFRDLPRWSNRFAIEIVTRNTNRSAGTSIASALKLSLQSLEKTNNTYVALLGPDYSSEAEPVTQIAPIYYLNSINMANSEKFRDTSAFPLMFKILPRAAGMQMLLTGLLEKLDIRRVSTLAFREQLFAENIVQFSAYWSAKQNCSIDRAAVMGLDDLHNQVKYLLAGETTVDYIVASPGMLSPYAVCEVYKSSAHMTVRPTFFEFLTWDVREIWLSALNDHLLNCTLDEMRAALNGSVFTVITNPNFVTDEHVLTRSRHDGLTLKRIQQYMRRAADVLGKSSSLDAQSYFTYDSAIAVYTALYRADVRMEQTLGVRLHQIDRRTTTQQIWKALADVLHEEIAATVFDGATSGDLIRFDQQQTRVGGRELIQYQGLLFDASEKRSVDNFVLIATLNSVTNEVVLDHQKLKFHTLTGEAPHLWRRNHPPIFDKNLLKNGQSNSMTTAFIIVAVFVALLAILGGSACWLLRRVKQEDKTLKDLSWVIKYSELTYKLPSKSALSLAASRYEQRSMSSFVTTASVPLIIAQQPHYIHTRTDTKLFIRKLSVINPSTTTTDAAKLNRLFLPAASMHRVAHDNVNRFFGICLDFQEPLSGETSAISAFEFRPNGSLADLFRSSDWLETDVSLKLFSMADCARGMLALHSAHITHGFLTSWNLLLDVNLTLKVTDYGLAGFGRSADELEPQRHSQNLSDEALEKLAFRSPEQIRAGFHGCDIMKSDVYSVGIVLTHIFLTGKLPEFANAAGRTFQYKNVVKEYQSFTADDYSSPVLHEKDGPLALRNLISDCTGRIADRPKLPSILKCLTSMPEHGSRSLVDTLIKELQRQTTDLEMLVAERTEALVKEASNNDQLLAQILPLSVATRLKAGSPVPPETFDCVSVYFSDIDGFLKLSAQRSPMQVVKLLNSIYTTFDGVLEKFDVYKVETIGAAYMVASGLPRLNGSNHVSEVCDFAITMQKTMLDFSAASYVDKKKVFLLRLRVGLHCGPCVAGVVGITLPRYCLFGDTINTASRMQSTGEASRIQATDTLRALAELHFPAKFDWHERGQVDAKGLGLITTHWLTY